MNTYSTSDSYFNDPSNRYFRSRIFNASIHASKKIIGSTFAEKLAIGALFGVAAGLVCAGIIHAKDAAVISTALLHGAKYLAISYASAFSFSNLCTKPVSKSDLSFHDRQKMEYVQKQVDEMARCGNKPITPPEVRVWRNFSLFDVIPAASLLGSRRRYIVFSPEYVQTRSSAVLGAVAGHEMAHIKLNHLHKRTWLYALNSVAFSFFPVLTSASLASLMLLSRRFEFQADRVGAALVGEPVTLANELKTFSDQKPVVDTGAFRYPSSASEKIGVMAGLGFRILFAPIKLFCRFGWAAHPHVARRVDRLTRMNEPDRPLRDLKQDLKLLPRTCLR